MTSKSPPDPELTERLRSLVGRLVVDLGIGEGRGAEGLATASVAMLGKMISPYDVTKVATTQTQRTLTERAEARIDAHGARGGTLRLPTERADARCRRPRSARRYAAHAP